LPMTRMDASIIALDHGGAYRVSRRDGPSLSLSSTSKVDRNHLTGCADHRPSGRTPIARSPPIPENAYCTQAACTRRYFFGCLTVRFTYFDVSQEPDPSSVYCAGSPWEILGFGILLVAGIALPFSAARIVFRWLQGIIVKREP